MAHKQGLPLCLSVRVCLCVGTAQNLAGAFNLNISDAILQSPGCSEAGPILTLGNTAQALVGEEHMSVGFNMAPVEMVLGGSYVFYVLAGKSHDIPANGLQ